VLELFGPRVSFRHVVRIARSGRIDQRTRGVCRTSLPPRERHEIRDLPQLR
jgi:hypothetical protein